MRSLCKNSVGLRRLALILLGVLGTPMLHAQSPAVADVGRLSAFVGKVRAGEPVKVVYYRGLADESPEIDWLKESSFAKALAAHGSKVEITRVSSLADLPAANADIYLIDATIPDSENGPALAALDATLKTLREKNPQVGLVMIYSTTPEWMLQYRKKTPPVIEEERQLASHYDMAEIDMAPQVANGAISGQWRQDEILDEGFTLGDRGYPFYAKVISESLVPALQRSSSASAGAGK